MYTTAPTVLPFDLLSLLQCVHCGETRFQDGGTRLLCDSCAMSYDVFSPGIPSLMRNEAMVRNKVHSQKWDGMPSADYDQICVENGLVWQAIDAVAVGYCSGTVLEVCCGNGRFLDVLSRHPQVKRNVGVDISMGMLNAAWAKGHCRLIHASADDLPIRDEAVDTVASSGSGLSFLPRKQTFVEIARILKPGGFFVFDLLNFWPSVIDCAWWQYLSKGRFPRREVLHEYKLAGNMRSARNEVQLLRRAGFQIVEMKSVQYVPFFRGQVTRLGYWSGFWGSRIGYDTIFVCQKSA